jgi:hypothetical protein
MDSIPQSGVEALVRAFKHGGERLIARVAVFFSALKKNASRALHSLFLFSILFCVASNHNRRFLVIPGLTLSLNSSLMAFVYETSFGEQPVHNGFAGVQSFFHMFSPKLLYLVLS